MEGATPSPDADRDGDARGRLSPLVGFGAGWFALCCLFWFGVTYENMMPGCAGPYDERALFAVAAALGPLSPLWIGNNSWDASLGVVVLVALAAMWLALRFRRILALRLLGFAVVFVWLFFGCAAGVTRIT